MGSGGTDDGALRAQSSPIAVVLIFGLVVAGTTAILVVGGIAITDTQDRLGTKSAENAMTQLSSDVSLVATNGAETQSTSLPANSGGSYTLNESAGNLTVFTDNGTANETLLTTELGTVTYENGDSTIAYQGGGVWRGGEGSSSMVSPPDVFYRNGTLTVQPTNISGDISSGGEVTIRKADTARKAQSLHDSLEDQNVYITVKSEYYRGWAQYFRTRTNSRVWTYPEDNRVEVKFIPPSTAVKIDSGIIGSGDLNVKSGSADVKGQVSLGGENVGKSISGDVKPNQPENMKLPSAALKIADAESRLSGETKPTGEVTAGDYEVNKSEGESLFNDQTTLDTTNGDINIYVDGDVKPSGQADLDIEGNNDVNIYIDGMFKMGGQVEWGSEPDITSLTVYSQSFERVTGFYGVIYTDEVDIAGKGGTAGVQGALISTDDEIKMTGNAKVEYDQSLGDRKLTEVETEFATILYLHVSESRVRLD